MFYVYALCDPRYDNFDDVFFNKPFYIGKGTGARLNDHIKEFETVKEHLGSTEYKKFIESNARRSASESGALNHNALCWTITMPDGKTVEVKGLNQWCRDNGFKHSAVYGSRNGFITIKHGQGKGGPRKKVNL